MKPEIKHRLVEEIKTMTILFVYLALLLGGFALYRELVLAEYRIPYAHLGYSLVEALLLSKIILIGRFLKVGERFSKRALVVPALYRALAFSVFVLLFSVFEHVVLELFEDQRPAGILWHIWTTRRDEIIAKVVVLYVAFVPLFAIWEMGRRTGEDNLFELFFKPFKPAP